MKVAQAEFIATAVIGQPAVAALGADIGSGFVVKRGQKRRRNHPAAEAGKLRRPTGAGAKAGSDALRAASLFG